jgi:hypothetical protein
MKLKSLAEGAAIAAKLWGKAGTALKGRDLDLTQIACARLQILQAESGSGSTGDAVHVDHLGFRDASLRLTRASCRQPFDPAVAGHQHADGASM